MNKKETGAKRKERGMSEQVLRPCAHCGHEAKMEFREMDDPNDPNDASVTCSNFECEFGGWWVRPSVWNKRPVEDALGERVEKLESMVERMIEAGNRLCELAEELDDLVDEFRAYPDLFSWRALVAEWKER